MSASAAAAADPAAALEGGAAAPFLKWAGGKRQLLPQLRRFVPPAFGTYVEPFLGSGALFFDLHARGLLAGRRAILGDRNVDLVGTYCALRDDPDRVIGRLADLEREHRLRDTSFYYEVRDARFNPARLRFFEAGGGACPEAYDADLAAMLIYLNRTCFNGLFRLNSRGQFNVPAGRYVRPRICDEPHLRRVSAILRQPGVTLRHGAADASCRRAGPGTFVYFDPPYAPVSQTARFRAYTADGFSSADQAALQRLVLRLARRGCAVLLSNSVAPEIAALYDGNPAAERAGLHAHRVTARRAINCDGTARGEVGEYLITNVA